MTPSPSCSSHKSGFTLLELSIVLAILALAMGSVLVGREMIRSAKIRALGNENETFTQSLRTFKDRYDFYPGDFPGATNVWGAQSTTPATCITLPAERGNTATCDGNGDGIIGGIGDGSPVTQSGQLYEMFRAWQHLVNAGLLGGYYTGVPFTSAAVSAAADAPLRDANSAAVFGQNAPEAAFRNNTGWNIATAWGLYNSCNDSSGKNLSGNVTVFASHADNEDFNLGMTDGTDNLLTPQEVQALDTKVDDSYPSTGNFQVVGINCATSCADTGVYNIAEDVKQCGLMYVNQY